MSATRDQRANAAAVRDDIDHHARALGHDMAWRLAPGANRKGRPYYHEGRCRHCGAQVRAGSSWSSSDGVRDARVEPCSGSGTDVLTDIEAGRLDELAADALHTFAGQVHEIATLAAYEREMRG